MNFKEFEHLALNPPRSQAATVFVVSEIDLGFLPDGRRNYYPKFDVYRHLVGYSCSLPGAEALMREAIAKAGDVDDIYCFHIVEHFLDYMERDNVSWRLYSKHGEMIDHSWHEARLKGDLPSVFRGRPESSLRFKAGDIVEVLQGNQVRLAVATHSPTTIEWCWEYRKRCAARFAGDNTAADECYNLESGDDQMSVIDGPGYEYHDHISLMNIMPLRFPIPSRLRKRFEGYWQVCLEKK